MKIASDNDVTAFGRRVMLGLSVVLLTACQLVAPEKSQTMVSEQGTYNATSQDNRPVLRRGGTYRVKPGDTLFVYVFDNPDLVQTVIVGPDGRFNYPLVGTVKAEGMTLNAIDSVLTRRLSQNILQPEVTVTLNEVASRRVFVTGEVISPGVFDVSEPVSVVQAISMAGGFTAFANRSQIIVYNPSRGADSRRSFDYEAFLRNPSGRDFALRPGDTVIVE
ncbi:polysaccharide biosynthesis/export family protein [Primorskyibacter sp. S187A]|uniref:polysaccharide biosynthesis/export family protein n=1 Tax=Primorskyibacter sp. S187A TaxID=3415130 RepID=UPI003C7C63EA